MNEVWISPDGQLATLVPVTCLVDEWYPDFPGQRPPASYEVHTLAGRVLRTDTVFPLDPWSPYDAIFDRLTREGWTPPALDEQDLAQCEHGLSANLCAGPGHYPMEDPYS